MERTSDLFRSLSEIKQYLDNLLPNIPPLFGLQALIIRPSIILFNIFFIVYEFYYIVLNNASYIIEKQQKLDEIIIGHKIVAYIEFVGLLLILLLLLCSYIQTYHATSIDLINKLGDWSSFYIFFMFRPTELLNNSSKLYKHYLGSYKYPKVTTNELNELKSNLQHEFDEQKEIEDEMATKLRNEEVNQLINKSAYKDVKPMRYHKNEYNDILKQMCYVDHIQHILNGIDNLIYNNNDLQNEMDEDDRNMAKTMEKDHTQNIHKIMIKISAFLASITLCLFGLILFILKLSQFDFVDNTKINNWSTNDWVLCFGFANQFWNMININNIRINTIYKLLYLNESLKFTNIISQKISILDGVIKQELCSNYGIKGVILALNINMKFLLKILTKDPFVTFDQLFIYNKNKKKQNELKEKQKVQQQQEQKEEEEKYPEEENRKGSVISVNVEDEEAGFYQVLLDDVDETKSQNFTTIIYSSFMDMKQNINDKIELTTTKATIHPYIDAKKIVVKYTEYKDLEIAKCCYLKRSIKDENHTYYSYELITTDAADEAAKQHNDENSILFIPNILFNENILFKISEWIITKLLFYLFIILFVLSGIFSLLVVIFEQESSNRCIDFWETHCLNAGSILTASLVYFFCLKKRLIEKKGGATFYKLICGLCVPFFVTAQYENSRMIFSSKCKHDLQDIDANYPLISMALYSNVTILLSMVTSFALLCIVNIHMLLWVIYLWFVWGSFCWRMIFNIVYWTEFGILMDFRREALPYNCFDKMYIKLIMNMIYWIVFGQICILLFGAIIAIPRLINKFTCRKSKKCEKCQTCIENKCDVLSKCYYHTKTACVVVILFSMILLMVLNIIFFASILGTENSSNSCSNMIHETALNRLKWIAFTDLLITLLACWFWLFHREVAKELVKKLWYENIIEQKILGGVGKKTGKNVAKNVANNVAR